MEATRQALESFAMAKTIATRAVVRRVAPGLAELYGTREATIDLPLAGRQHDAYVRALRDAGLAVSILPEDPSYPDSCFVEDTAVVLEGTALVASMGAAHRRGETPPVEAWLRSHSFEIVTMVLPATLEGGDVLYVGDTAFVGLSSRTNWAGAERLRDFLKPHGIRCVPIPVTSCLHLKTACTYLGRGTLLVNPALVPTAEFRGLRTIAVDPTEPLGANVLLVNGRCIASNSYPRTNARLLSAGFDVVEVALSEFEKAKGSATCLSIILH